MPIVSAAANAVTVWSATLDLVRPQWTRLLDPAESHRWRELRRAGDRDRFLLASCLVRAVAAHHLATDPEDVRLDRTCADCDRAHGKTSVLGSDLEVSVSHSGGWVLVAATTAGAVGVDIEEVDPSIDLMSLAATSLADRERERLAALPEPDRLAAFFRYWTRKEAALKSTGDGLRCPPSEIIVSAADEPAAVVSWLGQAGSGIRLADLDIAGGYAACVGYAASTWLPVRVTPAATVLAGLD